MKNKMCRAYTSQKPLSTAVKILLAVFLSSILVATNTETARAQISTDGLVGHWPLDGNADDTSGNGHHGTINGAVPTSGKSGGAYQFDGDDGIDVGNLDFSSGQYTVSVWIRTTAPAVEASWRMMIGKLNNGTGGGPFELYFIRWPSTLLGT